MSIREKNKLAFPDLRLSVPQREFNLVLNIKFETPDPAHDCWYVTQIYLLTLRKTEHE